MCVQCRRRCYTEDVIDLSGAAKIKYLRAAIVAVTTQQDIDARSVGADGAQQVTQKAVDLLAAGRFDGRRTAVMNRPSPSNTAIG